MYYYVYVIRVGHTHLFNQLFAIIDLLIFRFINMSNIHAWPEHDAEDSMAGNWLYSYDCQNLVRKCTIW